MERKERMKVVAKEKEQVEKPTEEGGAAPKTLPLSLGTVSKGKADREFQEAVAKSRVWMEENPEDERECVITVKVKLKAIQGGEAHVVAHQVDLVTPKPKFDGTIVYPSQEGPGFDVDWRMDDKTQRQLVIPGVEQGRGIRVVIDRRDSDQKGA